MVKSADPDADKASEDASAATKKIHSRSKHLDLPEKNLPDARGRLPPEGLYISSSSEDETRKQPVNCGLFGGNDDGKSSESISMSGHSGMIMNLDSSHYVVLMGPLLQKNLVGSSFMNVKTYTPY
jgi:hypothetical protein